MIDTIPVTEANRDFRRNSSAATIQRIPGRVATEDDAETWPITEWRPLYSTVKVAMEHEAMRAARNGLPLVVVNPSVCIGEYDAHLFSGRIILTFVKQRIPFYVNHTLNAVYTGDVGVGHLRAAERGQIGQRYLLANQNISLRECAELATQEASLPPPRICVPYRLALAAAIASEGISWITRREPLLPRQAVHASRAIQQLDSSKAVRELGLPQTPIDEAIRRALGWFRAHGYL